MSVPLKPGTKKQRIERHKAGCHKYCKAGKPCPKLEEIEREG